jgi:hypothetical protein
MPRSGCYLHRRLERFATRPVPFEGEPRRSPTGGSHVQASPQHDRRRGFRGRRGIRADRDSQPLERAKSRGDMPGRHELRAGTGLAQHGEPGAIASRRKRCHREHGAPEQRKKPGTYLSPGDNLLTSSALDRVSRGERSVQTRLRGPSSPVALSPAAAKARPHRHREPGREIREAGRPPFEDVRVVPRRRSRTSSSTKSPKRTTRSSCSASCTGLRIADPMTVALLVRPG